MGRAKVFITAVILFITAVFSASACSADEPSYLKSSFLRTSYNPESYALFEISGNTLFIRGVYKNDRIDKLFFPGTDYISGTYKLKSTADGGFEAEVSLPEGYVYTNICIRLKSGAEFGYRINYSNGWYFMDNGLAESNRKVFDNIINENGETAAYYLSETADPNEIAEVQQRLREISDAVAGKETDDYEKARLLSRYVAENYYYDHDARKTSVSEKNIVLSQVLKKGRCVCTGFADLYCALLQAQGIDAVNIKGGSTGGEITYRELTDGVQNHEFTAFYYKKESRWVWVDSCWNGSGDYENGEYTKNLPHEEFFDITDEALSLDHRADYAIRRDFFGAKGAEPSETTMAATEEATTPQQTTQATTTAQVQIITEHEDVTAHEENAEDNTVFYVIIGILGVSVIIAAGAVVKIIRKK